MSVSRFIVFYAIIAAKNFGGFYPRSRSGIGTKKGYRCSRRIHNKSDGKPSHSRKLSKITAYRNESDNKPSKAEMR